MIQVPDGVRQTILNLYRNFMPTELIASVFKMAEDDVKEILEQKDDKNL